MKNLIFILALVLPITSFMVIEGPNETKNQLCHCRDDAANGQSYEMDSPMNGPRGKWRKGPIVVQPQLPIQLEV